MSLTSDELNYVVLRYLLESGFVHSAFSFAHESFVAKTNINSSDVPPGALISFVQKGLQYAEIEAHVNEDGTELACDGKFSLIGQHQCQPTSRKRVFDPNEPLDAEYGVLDVDDHERFALHGHTSLICVIAWNPARPLLITGSADGTARLWELSAEVRGISKKASSTGTLLMGEEELNRQTAAILDNVIVLDPIQPAGLSDIKEATDAVLPAPPSSNSNSGESAGSAPPSASSGSPHKRRRKDMKDKIASAREDPAVVAVAAIQSAWAGAIPRNRAIVAADWNAKGTKLALGSYDGRVYIYAVNASGSPYLNHVLALPSSSGSASANPSGSAQSAGGGTATNVGVPHNGPVSAVRFSKGKGDLLISAGIDGTVCVWDVASSSLVRRYAADSGSAHSTLKLNGSAPSANLREVSSHTGKSEETVDAQPLPTGAILDADWRDEHVFAIAGKDRSIFVFDTNRQSAKPAARIHAAHDGDINALRWCPLGRLASGSDDGTAKIWSVLQSDKERPTVNQNGTNEKHSRQLNEQKEADAVASGSSMTDEDRKSSGLIVKKESDDLAGSQAQSVETIVITRPTLKLTGHERAISSLRFNVEHLSSLGNVGSSESGGITNGFLPNGNPSPKSLIYLATASQDTTIKVWELERGRCVMTLARHIHPVNGIAWSAPSTELMAQPITPGGLTTGQLIASCSHERVHIWSAGTGKLVKSFRAGSDVGDIAWCGSTQLAVGAADGVAYIIDVQI